MRQRLQELVDFGRLNSAAERLSVVATDLQTGKTVIFDSRREPIRMEHLLATCGFVPEFAPVQIDGKLLGDGGLSANVPIEAVLFEGVESVFVLACFARDGDYSPDLETALARKNDVIYGNQTLRALELLMRDRMQANRTSKENLFYLSYRPARGEAGSERLYDYSEDMVEARWQSGATDMSKAIECYRTLQPTPDSIGLHVIR